MEHEHTGRVSIQPYASHTGTRRNLDAMRANSFGMLLSASGHFTSSEGFALVGLDNGAWSAFINGEEWDESRFLRLVEQHGQSAEWIVIPDVVTKAAATLALAPEWIGRLKGIGRRRLFAVQDGMKPDDVLPLIGPDVGVFLGGSTEFKWSTVDLWGSVAREAGAYYHVARVNTRRAICSCQIAGADSFDGTSATIYSVNANFIGHAARQEVLPWR